MCSYFYSTELKPFNGFDWNPFPNLLNNMLIYPALLTYCSSLVLYPYVQVDDVFIICCAIFMIAGES